MSTTKETVLVRGVSGLLGYEAVQWLLEHYDGPME